MSHILCLISLPEAGVIVGIAVISAIFAQPDITKATAELKALTEKTVAND